MDILEGLVTLPACPEQAGGLATPRPPAEITGGSATEVLAGAARVITSEASDVTDAFIKGAYHILALAVNHNVKYAVFKERSPSCGCSYTYDGTFNGKLIRGPGVATALLRENGIIVYSDEQLQAYQSIRETLFK